MKTPLVFLIFLAMIAVSSTAFAGGSEALYYVGGDVPVVVATGNGFVFIDKDLQPYRAFEWKQSKATPYSAPYYLVDLDQDKNIDFVGAGQPTFALNNNADPLWFDMQGCDQLIVADFAADDHPDLACVNKSSIRILTYDYQMIWKLDLGKRIDYCTAEDLNGDQKADLECKFAGQKLYARIDGNTGKTIALDSPEQKVTTEYQPKVAPVGATTKDAIGGRVSFKGKPISLLDKDINGDGANDMILLTDKEIVVKDGVPSKKEVHLSLNAKSYKRYPFASIKDLYVSGFKDDTAASAKVNGLDGELAKCYANAVKKSPFVGSGRLMVQGVVDSSGKIKDLQKIYSALPDNKIYDCAKKVLEGEVIGELKGDSANVNLTILYSFKSK